MDDSYTDPDGKREKQRRFSISEVMGKIYKDIPQPTTVGHVKSLGEYIKFTNEGKPTRAEQLRRDRKLYEASGYSVEPEVDPIQSTHGEVVGSVDDMPDSKSRKKGLEVSFINGQIVLDRSTLNRQVDRLDMNDSDDENLLGDLVEHNARQRKHKIVVWSVEETRQFYDCLRRFGTDFFMMNKVITNRTRRDLKNKYKTEEKRNPKLVSLILAVHLKEKVKVPEVEATQDKLPDDLQPKEPVTELRKESKEPEKESELIPITEDKEDEDDDDGDIVGALSESSEESSNNDIILDDLISIVFIQTEEKRLHKNTMNATRMTKGAHVRRNPFIDKK